MDYYSFTKPHMDGRMSWPTLLTAQWVDVEPRTRVGRFLPVDGKNGILPKFMPVVF